VEELHAMNDGFIYLATRLCLIFAGLGALCIVDFLANG